MLTGRSFSSATIALFSAFLLVFRTQIAYSRFWEGGSILQDMRSSWLNVTSSLVAFTTTDAKKKAEIEHFLHLLIRLMSMMHCSALQEVADLEDENFDIINCDGFDEGSMRFLISLDAGARVEILMQWIQRLIVSMQASGVVSSAPPIVSRCFQELADGRMSFNAAKKIAAFPFPFPYAQMLMVMLMMHWVAAPFMAALALEDPILCVTTTFVTSLAFWSINYIAAEIEMPFGDNPNDLPVEELQVNFNSSLKRLMEPLSQSHPAFKYRQEFHGKIENKKMASVEAFFLEDHDKLAVGKKGSTLSACPAAFRGESSESLSPRQAGSTSPTLNAASASSTKLQPKQDLQTGPAASSSKLEQVEKTQGWKPCASDCGFRATWLDSHCCRVCNKTGGVSHGQNCTMVPLPKMLESQQESQSNQSANASNERRTGLPGLPPSASLAVRLGNEMIGVVQERKKGAPMSVEEWQAFDTELALMAVRVEERLRRIVQELVPLLVPAACGRLAEASWLAQGFAHPLKPWTPASETLFVSPQPMPSGPDPDFFQVAAVGEVVLSPMAELSERFHMKPFADHSTGDHETSERLREGPMTAL